MPSISVPSEFTPKMPLKYPDHNDLDFERFFFDNYKGENYLGVQWTACQLKIDLQRDHRLRNRLQDYLNSLDRSKEYFTIVQHDDGIKFKLPFKCKVFGMGSVQDYPLPLLSQPHQIRIEAVKDIPVSFVGGLTHPIRRRIPQVKHWYLSNRPHHEEAFCRIMARSEFALCPRGYGVTSFRIQEALEYGAIPVYISDRFIIPHHVPFDQYGVLVHSNNVRELQTILAKIPESERRLKRENGKRILEKYYTYHSNLKLIEDAV